MSFLDFPSALKLSLCNHRLRAAVFDPIRWPRLSLRARATDKAIILIRKLYGSKRSALRELKLKYCTVTSAFFRKLSQFLGDENAISKLYIRDCTLIATLDLHFPHATHITVLGMSSDVASLRS